MYHHFVSASIFAINFESFSNAINALCSSQAIRERQTAANKRVKSLLDLNNRDYKPDYDNNALLRHAFRSDRKVKRERKEEAKSHGLAIGESWHSVQRYRANSKRCYF